MPVLLFAVGGFLLGGAWATRRNVVLAAALALCAVVAVVTGFLRYP